MIAKLKTTIIQVHVPGDQLPNGKGFTSRDADRTRNSTGCVVEPNICYMAIFADLLPDYEILLLFTLAV